MKEMVLTTGTKIFEKKIAQVMVLPKIAKDTRLFCLGR